MKWNGYFKKKSLYLNLKENIYLYIYKKKQRNEYVYTLKPSSTEKNLLLSIVFIKIIPKIEFIFVREKQICTYIYICLYICKERERERKKEEEKDSNGIYHFGLLA